MRTQIVADAILIVHALIVLFIIGALPLIWLGYFRRWRWVRNFWFRMAHLALIGFVAAEATVGVICPLTTWENALRDGAGPRYEQGFVSHWVQRLLFHDLDERVFTISYLTFFALVFITFLCVKPRRPLSTTRPSTK